MSAERTARANEEGLPKMRSGNLRVSANNESRAGQPGDKNETLETAVFNPQRRRVVAGLGAAAAFLPSAPHPPGPAMP